MLYGALVVTLRTCYGALQIVVLLCLLPHRAEALSNAFVRHLIPVCLTSVCLSHTSGLTQEQRPRKTKIGTEVAYVTRDSDTTFKVKRSKVNLLLMS